MQTNKYRTSIAVITAIANLIFVAMIIHSVWSYHVGDKSNPAQYQISQNAEQGQKRFKSDEVQLHILAYQVLPANAMLGLFSAYVLWRLRK
jgi:hypothetical protein